jgi:hypothetical protein
MLAATDACATSSTLPMPDISTPTDIMPKEGSHSSVTLNSSTSISPTQKRGVA